MSPQPHAPLLYQALGLEDDNSRGDGKLVLPARDELGGRAFRSGDHITLLVDFAADTLTIHRNKGGVRRLDLDQRCCTRGRRVWITCPRYWLDADRAFY
jgi:hypothetical protein